MLLLFEKIYKRLSKKQKEKVIYIYKYYKLIISFPRNIVSYAITYLLKDKKIKNINIFEQRFYSQNGEDGILKIIFYKIGVTNKFCVEFGIDTIEGNTVYFQKKGWECLWMDSTHFGKNIKNEYVTAENINELFKKYDVPIEFDLLSIDIDFNDYWVWKAIKGYSPRVVVIEYNSSISPTESRVVEYNPDSYWDGTNYFGASLLALTKLGGLKGYTLIACDKSGNNSFFVRNDLLDGFEIRSVEKIYRPPGYGKKINGRRIGHPISDKSMILV